MTRGYSRATVIGLMTETTEGTLRDPEATTDFIAGQPDVEITPNIESLTNEELRSSIGASKSIQGLEAPEASLSHYIRHSGVEGQVPNYGDLLKAAWGSQTANGTQRTTTTSSTTSLIKLGAGGSDFARGFAVLAKDGTNGYSIRAIHSVSSNDLTPGFNLASAPASGVGMGKCVNYSPANVDHSSVSLVRYVGNGHAIDAIAGGKVTEVGISAEAGNFIQGSFSLVGTKYFWNPMEIVSTDAKLDFYDGSTDYAATVTQKWYRSPHELATALQTSMNSQGASDTYTVIYNDRGASAGKFTISTSGSTLSLKWSTGTNTANTIGDKIGFSVGSDDTGATTYTSDNVISWAPPYTPAYDSADPLVAKNNEVMIGNGSDYVAFCANSIDFTLSNSNAQVQCVSAETGVDANIFNGREVTCTISGTLDKYEAEFFNRFIDNTETRMQWSFGEKSGGNWVAGKCGCLYLAAATVSSYSVTDLDGVVGVEIELKAFVDSNGNGEVYLNFL